MFKEQYSALAGYAYQFTKDKEWAEDVVQHSFIQLWKNRHRIVWGDELVGYLYKSVKVNALDQLRKSRRHEELNQVYVDKKNAQEDPDEWRQRQWKAALYQGIEQLPPRCRAVFKLIKFRGFSYAEAAEELEISVKTVENQMLRALKLLRDLLKDWDHED